jgi:peptidoglycan/LPS O-acetylase OafA/YrhL
VSRFSRLFPVYWVSLGITFLVIVLFPQLGISVSLLQALGNMLMFHGFLGITDIDGVYWTLEVELIFYTLMFLIWLSGGLKNPVRVIVIWLMVCILAAVAAKLGKPLPYVVTRILLLKYFAYFSLGLLMYLFYRSREFSWKREGIAGALAFVSIGIADGMTYAVWTVGFLLLFWYAIFSWKSSPITRTMTRLGIISYPIYLLHENIGWTLIHGLERSGVNAHLAILAAFLVIVALSAVLHVIVEKPAQKGIRAWYKARTATPVAPTRAVRMSWIGGTLLVTAAILIANRLSLQQ